MEEAVQREVAEEVGLEVESMQYSASQHWPFPNSSLMIACHAAVKPGQTEVSAGVYLPLGCFLCYAQSAGQQELTQHLSNPAVSRLL